ncbi:hypothetical protein EDB86DRAFT_2798963 [Lactarius hatsudake]|nr:hypothetical protein EDB86DRAFT_2798963 [Lactarius hatsudake]
MNTVNSSLPLGRSAAELISINKIFLSSCEPLDRLLGNGLPSGHILELSGPPGTAKESLVVKFVSNAVSSNDQVLFIGKSTLFTATHSLYLPGSRNLPDTTLDLVHYLNIFTLPTLLAFLHNLPSGLQIRLVVLNSIWFPFQTSPTLTQSRRATLLARVKQVLARLCSSLDISVVITSQMATKLLTPDGSPASFDTGSRAVLVPQLGNGGTYLPLNRTYRVLIVPETRTTGFLVFSLYAEYPKKTSPSFQGVASAFASRL